MSFNQGEMMKLLLILATMISTTIAFGSSDFTKRVVCEAHSFRPDNGYGDFNNYGKVYLKVQSKAGQVTALEYGGFVAFDNYHGIFKGSNMAERPYVRASTYQNHYRFADFDAELTFGSEDGMWGYLAINKDIATLGYQDETDAHYVFQAGDHMGGTIDFTCTKEGY